MIYGSICSGIEAASVAWHPLGWEAAFVSEIDKFPRAVLAHHYPEVPLHGDFTTIQDGDYRPIDLLVGGTPCQSFSIAGLRGGLDDDRGNLALEYLRLADRLRPRWLVWENVPGVLSSNGGKDFGAILGGMVELGYGCAWRVLDAQYFGLAQRRKRVFVVGYFGDWRRATAVLFEPEGLRGDPSPRRQKGKKIADTLSVGANQCSGFPGDFTEDVKPLGFETGPSGGGFIDLRPTLDTRCKDGPIRNQLGAGVLCADIALTINAGFGQTKGLDNQHIDGGGGLFVVPPVAMCLNAGSMGRKDPTSETMIPVYRCGEGEAIAPTLTSSGDNNTGFCDEKGLVELAFAVRRLTPTECERLQGFPDGYTLIPYRGKPASDGPRYKALGNSMAVPVMGWIGERIQMVDNLPC